MTSQHELDITLRFRIEGIGIADVVDAFGNVDEATVSEKKGFGGSHDHWIEVALALVKYGPDAAAKITKFGKLAAKKFMQIYQKATAAQPTQAGSTLKLLVTFEDSNGNILRTVDITGKQEDEILRIIASCVSETTDPDDDSDTKSGA